MIYSEGKVIGKPNVIIGQTKISNAFLGESYNSIVGILFSRYLIELTDLTEKYVVRTDYCWHICMPAGFGELYRNYCSILYKGLRDDPLCLNSFVEEVYAYESTFNDSALGKPFLT